MTARPVRLLLSSVALLLTACGQSSTSGDTASTRSSCALGSSQLRSAVELTLRGLDPGVFTRFAVLEPPPPPLHSDHYAGPLWAYATVAAAPDPRTQDVSGAWQATLAQGAVAERCSLGTDELQHVVAGSTIRYATGTHGSVGGMGVAPAGEVFGAQASGESDGQLIADATRELRDFGLTPRAVRVLHPLGPALLVVASTDDPASVEGRMGELETALGGARGHRRFEGLYVAVDGPDGPLFRGESAARTAGGGQWFARGFDSGIPHG
jgi:hypothetical protein